MAAKKPAPPFLAFEVILQLSGVAQRQIFALPNETPRAARLGPFGHALMVLLKSAIDVVR